MTRILLLSATALLLASSFVGCGYTTGSSLDEQYRTVYVEPFRNATREYDLQAPLTNAVTRKFLNDTRLRVTGPEAADLIVSGTLVEYDVLAITFGKDDDPSQMRTVVRARVSVVDSRTGEVLWEDDKVAGENTFATAETGADARNLRGNAEVFLYPVRSFPTDQENRAASEALENLASNIFYRTIEPW